LRLRLRPCVRLLDTTQLAMVADAPAIADADSTMGWLFWRDADGDVHWRQLEHDEADALHAIARGADFGELCERLSTQHDDASARAASLLKRWLADGLLAAPNTAD
jgi:hypothetical protein